MNHDANSFWFCFLTYAFGSEVEKYDENIHEKTAEQGGTPTRYYFENLKISIPQVKLSVFTSSKLPLDLKVSLQLTHSPWECAPSGLFLCLELVPTAFILYLPFIDVH